MSYLYELRRRTRLAREARQAATLGTCPACRERLVITRSGGELRCRRCGADPVVTVGERERKAVFRVLRAEPDPDPGARRPFVFPE